MSGTACVALYVINAMQFDVSMTVDDVCQLICERVPNAVDQGQCKMHVI